MLLLVCMVDTISFALGIDKLGAEFLVGLFEMCDSAAWWALKSIKNRFRWIWTHLNFRRVFENWHEES